MKIPVRPAFDVGQYTVDLALIPGDACVQCPVCAENSNNQGETMNKMRQVAAKALLNGSMLMCGAANANEPTVKVVCGSGGLI